MASPSLNGRAGRYSATCRVCGKSGPMTGHEVREMQLGLRDRFLYLECPECACLQIAEIPADMSRYYPPSYYSFKLNPDRRSGLKRGLRTLRNRYVLAGRGLAGGILSAAFPYRFAEAAEWLRRPGVSQQSRILDVGCGTGELVNDLANLGYRNVLGIDPFIGSDLEYANGARVLRRPIEELDGEFDLITFVHSFEHIANPAETLAAAARLLSPSGYCVIWTPVIPCYAWEYYRENWIQLDAPRHVIIHSVAGLRRLAQQAHLLLEEVRHNSTEFQFTGSELYRRDLPLTGNERSSSWREVRRYRRRAKELNALGQGDQAAFFFRKERPDLASSRAGSAAVHAHPGRERVAMPSA